MNYKVWAPELGMQQENALDVATPYTMRDAAEYFVRTGMAHGRGVCGGEVLVYVLSEDGSGDCPRPPIGLLCR